MLLCIKLSTPINFSDNHQQINIMIHKFTRTMIKASLGTPYSYHRHVYGYIICTYIFNINRLRERQIQNFPQLLPYFVRLKPFKIDKDIVDIFHA